ncbi:MAG: glycosyltransferase family 2 protein [Chloroflexi bacterium]|nr:glycosyltransferase family 2 protein [Chloroflexota bacterium]
METPLVSVIILNYNGAKYLPVCLDALHHQTYAQDRFEVIVADNGSSDDSLSLLKEKYPWVKIIENGRNLGFSRGNNAAIWATNSDFVVLLNNDTAPSDDWLINLVQTALDHPEAGMVTSHLQMFYDEIELELTTETFTPQNDPRQLGVQFFDVNSGLPHGVIQYLDGFYGWETHPACGRFRWMGKQARLGLSVPPGNEAWEVQLDLSAGRDTGSSIHIEIRLQGNLIADWQVQGKNIETYHLTLPATARQYAHVLEQNAGSIVFRSGAGRDRGTYVKNNELFFEVDSGQYGAVEEVFAGCGAALLLRRAMLAEVGSLDDDFFMYYEDTDLSWRARLYGWKVLYASPAKVRHIHCGTTKEWSPNFIYLTERNRLAMVFKNGTIVHAARVWGGYGLKVACEGFQVLKKLLTFQPSWRAYARQLCTHLRVILSLLCWLPSLLKKRHKIMRCKRISPNQLQTWFAEGD